MKSIRWRCMCIKAPRVPLAMLPLTLGLAAVDAQLAACERAVCGGGWVGSEASEFTKERLIGEMVKRFTMFKEWTKIKDTGTSEEVKSLHDLYGAQYKVVEALIKAGGDAYPSGVVNECQLTAVDIMDASKAGGGGSKGGSN